MDYEKFKQDMEQDVLKNLANRGIEAETDVQHIDKLIISISWRELLIRLTRESPNL